MESELNSDQKKAVLEKAISSNAGAIQSADNKANIIITSISLLIGFYTAFLISPILNAINSKEIQLSNQFFIFQVVFFVSFILCLFFAVWTIWPRLNLKDYNPLESPQIFFFHYIASETPNERKSKILEFIDNIIPIWRARKNNPETGKKNYQKKIDSLTESKIKSEYIDQIWELAQIAERKMWLIRGATIWFSSTVIFLVLSIISLLLS